MNKNTNATYLAGHTHQLYFGFSKEIATLTHTAAVAKAELDKALNNGTPVRFVHAVKANICGGVMGYTVTATDVSAVFLEA
jgi:hypothetical protein